MENKKENFKQAVIDFDKSDKSTLDYIEFLVLSNKVVKQGSGITWSEITEILDEVLTK